MAIPETADKVAVTVVEPDVSAMVVAPVDSVTVGAVSSSVIVTVCCCVPDSFPLMTVEIAMKTVSLSCDNS